MNKIRLMFMSDTPTIPTGFGRVGKSIAKFLSKDDYDISWLGVNYRGDPHSLPFRIYPPGGFDDPYGFTRLMEVLEKEQPQVIWILNDAWVQRHYLGILNEALEKKLLKTVPKIVTYTPVDARFHDPDWYVNFHIVDAPVAYTQFGRREIISACPELEEKIRIIPHGIDTENFYKLTATKEEAKQNYFRSMDITQSMIFLSAQRNQPRKRLDILMEAYAIFSRGKPDVFLYMHCGLTDESMDISKLASRYGIGDEGTNKLLLSNLLTGTQRIPDKRLNEIYNFCDVGLNSSVGEGWGLPNMEHAMTGAPQIVPNHSALTEIWSDCGLLVPTSSRVTLDDVMTIGEVITPVALAEKMEEIYQNKTLYDLLAKKALEKFSVPEYQWENISKTWDTIFKELV